MLIARRKNIDGLYLTVGVLMTVWWLICLERGETFIPSKRGPGYFYQLAVDPRGFWTAMKFQAGVAGFFFLASATYCPLLRAWNVRSLRQMQYERRHPLKRSFLWKVGAYGVLPLVIVVGVLALVIYIGGR